jgi:hypothetical protein
MNSKKRVFRVWRSIITILGLYSLIQLTFELAGSALAKSALVTENELRFEFSDVGSPDSFFVAFGTAVLWQRTGRNEGARELYAVLLKMLRANAPHLYNRVSPFIEHNLELLAL